MMVKAIVCRERVQRFETMIQLLNTAPNCQAPRHEIRILARGRGCPKSREGPSELTYAKMTDETLCEAEACATCDHHMRCIVQVVLSRKTRFKILAPPCNNRLEPGMLAAQEQSLWLSMNSLFSGSAYVMSHHALHH